MMGYEDIMNSYRFISVNGAKTLHISDSYGVEEGKAANFIVLDARNYYECLNKDAALLASYRNGKKIVEGRSAETKILV